MKQNQRITKVIPFAVILLAFLQLLPSGQPLHLADHPLGSRPGHRYGNHYWLAVCPAQDDLFLHGHHVYGAGYCAADFLLGSGRRRNGVAGNSVFE